MNIWTELTTPAGKRDGYDNMVGNTVGAADQIGSLAADSGPYRLYVPFQFWFNRNPGLALPLIALQYHEVKLNLEIRPLTDLIQGAPLDSGTATGTSIKLYVDYVYLDTDERRRFAQVSHEYLIEQVQFTGTETVTGSNKNVTLNFNHPVKELIWAHTTSNRAQAFSSTVTGSGCWFNYSGSSTTTGADSFTTALLQLNGHDRFSVRYSDYFRKVQNIEHHTRVPRVGSDLAGMVSDAKRGYMRQYIYSYSFALSPEEHQPSGTCNFSRIDNAVLQLSYGTDPQLNVTPASALSASQSLNLNVYAVNYNVLRIMSGMGGLAYSN
jgi:hypothetical protein